MKQIFIKTEYIKEFENHLICEEKSINTIEKYMRDVRAFTEYLNGAEVTKEKVIDYKKHLQGTYKTRSINSMLASINSLFDYLGLHEMKVKTIKIQQQIYCPEEKELTKDEYERLCKTAERKHNERLNLILQTICGTGIRVFGITIYHRRSGEKRRGNGVAQGQNEVGVYCESTETKAAPLLCGAGDKVGYNFCNENRKAYEPYKHLAGNESTVQGSKCQPK